jgi:hypothetical protein
MMQVSEATDSVIHDAPPPPPLPLVQLDRWFSDRWVQHLATASEAGYLLDIFIPGPSRQRQLKERNLMQRNGHLGEIPCV